MKKLVYSLIACIAFSMFSLSLNSKPANANHLDLFANDSVCVFSNDSVINMKVSKGRLLVYTLDCYLRNKPAIEIQNFQKYSFRYVKSKEVTYNATFEEF